MQQEQNLAIQQRFAQLIPYLETGLIEKEEVLRLSLLAALSGESIFLLGKPGVAKSLIARRIKYAFQSPRAFEYLMNRFSTPDEIFGPVSISKLKNEDSYERLIEGYLPDANVVFLDEIWKAGPAIQNALLTVLNEKKYRNGHTEINLPLKALIAASNELPIQGEGLEALWDRFLIRYIVEPIEKTENFEALLLQISSPFDDNIPDHLKIKDEEYLSWQKSIDFVECPQHIIAIILEIRQQIALLNEEAQSTKNEALSPIYISDRRWRKIMRLLRANAFFNGRNILDASDCFLIKFCIWHIPKVLPILEKIVQQSIEKAGIGAGNISLKSLEEDLEKLQVEIQTQTTGIEHIVKPKIFEGRYYEIASTNTVFRYILKHEFDAMQMGSTEQIWQLQAWQTYPRQSYPNGHLRAQLHTTQKQTHFYEISNYGMRQLHSLVTEVSTKNTKIAATALQKSNWDNLIVSYKEQLQKAEQSLFVQQQLQPQQLFLQNTFSHIQKDLHEHTHQHIRRLHILLEKIQDMYKD